MEKKTVKNQIEIDSLIKQHLKDLRYAQERYKGVYIARILIGDQVSIEVEINEGTVAFICLVELESTNETYSLIIERLAKFGINTYLNYGDFGAEFY